MVRRQFAFWLLYILGKPLLIALFRLAFRMRVVGRERVPRRGGLILVSNHLSYFDPPLLGTFTPRPVDWMAMEELFRNRPLAALIRILGAFPVNRQKADSTAVREAVRRLRAGRCVAIFPEGGIRLGADSALEGDGTLKEGAVALARLAPAPLLPVYLEGTRAPYRLTNWFFRRPTITIRFGEPFFIGREATRRHSAEVLRERMRQLARAGS